MDDPPHGPVDRHGNKMITRKLDMPNHTALTFYTFRPHLPNTFNVKQTGDVKLYAFINQNPEIENDVIPGSGFMVELETGFVAQAQTS